MIKGIIFDCDGTLFGSETSSFQAWKEVFDQHNAILPLEEWIKCLGASPESFDIISYLESQTSVKINRNKLLQKWLKRKIELVNLEGLRDGVIAYLAHAKKTALKLRVASSSSREWVIGHLERLFITAEFEAIICSDDVKNVKPHPELYLKSTERLALDPTEVIAIEDSPNGILAAKAAGVFCVAVPNKLTSRLDLTEADLILKSLSEIPLGELLERINGQSFKESLSWCARRE